jgi:phage terminase small subunit
MAAKLKITNAYRAFAASVAGGEDAYKAFLRHIGTPKTSPATAKVKASRLLQQPPIKALVAKASEELNRAIVKANIETLPEELKTAMLTIDQIDSFHYAVIKNLVEVEEIHPVTTIRRDKNGREVERTVTFHKVKRKANIRERQLSTDYIYKRLGSYAPTKIFGAFKDLDEPTEKVARTLILSNGVEVDLP